MGQPDSSTNSAEHPKAISPTAAYLTSKVNIETQEREGFRPRTDNQPYPLDLPIDWAADPFRDRNWCFQLHGWRMMDPYLKLYLAKRDAVPLAKAWVFLEDWSDFHREHSAEYSWYDMSTGLRALKLSVFLDAVRLGDFTPVADEWSTLFGLVERHLENLSDPENINPNNHGLFQLAGLKQLALRAFGRAGIDPALVDRARHFSDTAIVELLSSFYTSEGVNKEHSPSYHMFVGRIIEQLNIASLFPDVRGVAEILDGAGEVTPWMTHPDGSLACFGDTTGKGILLPPEAQADLATADVIVRDLSVSGLVTARTPPNTPSARAGMLIVTGAQWSHSHKHADDLSYELSHQGNPLVIDGGKFAYKRHPFRRYVKSAAAHSSLAFLNTEILPGDERGSWLSPPSISGREVHIEGEIDRLARLRHRRRFIYAPHRYLIVRDKYDAALDDTVVSTVLLHPRLEVAGAGANWTISHEGGKIAELLVHGADQVLVRRGWDDGTNRMVPGAFAGWRSPGYDKIEPATCIQALSSQLSGSLAYAIVFDPAFEDAARRGLCG